MLQVCVHHCDVGGAGGKHTLDTSARETSSSNAANTSHMGIGGGQFTQTLHGSVRRVIVYKHRFPRNTLQSVVQTFDQHAHIERFVESGYDDRQSRPLLRVLRLFVGRTHGECALGNRGKNGGHGITQPVRLTQYTRVVLSVTFFLSMHESFTGPTVVKPNCI